MPSQISFETNLSGPPLRNLLAILDRRELHSWVVGCGGNETVFSKNGLRYLYMFNTITYAHAYYCLDRDVFLSDAEASKMLNY